MPFGCARESLVEVPFLKVHSVTSVISMNNEESQLLRDFLSQLTLIRGVSKDAEADRLIQEAAVSQPDALYLLVQKAMLQDQALRQSQARIQALQQQVDQARRQPASPTSADFLARDPWAATASRTPYSSPGAPAPMSAAPMGGGPWGGSPVSSFLGTAAATAAGVAGGAFLFHGIESLMSHHAHGADFTDTAYDDPHAGPENVTVNQYYGNGVPEHQDGAQPGFGESFPASQDDWDSYDDDVNSVDA
jgi:uncharacterized protein